MVTEKRFLRFPDVSKITGLSRSAIYARISADDFPRPIPLGPRAVGFLSSDIDQWIIDRVEAAKNRRSES